MCGSVLCAVHQAVPPYKERCQVVLHSDPAARFLRASRHVLQRPLAPGSGSAEPGTATLDLRGRALRVLQ